MVVVSLHLAQVVFEIGVFETIMSQSQDLAVGAFFDNIYIPTNLHLKDTVTQSSVRVESYHPRCMIKKGLYSQILRQSYQKAKLKAHKDLVHGPTRENETTTKFEKLPIILDYHPGKPQHNKYNQKTLAHITKLGRMQKDVCRAAYSSSQEGAKPKPTTNTSQIGTTIKQPQPNPNHKQQVHRTKL